MGMSTYLTLFKSLPADGAKLIKLKEHCDEIGISYPKEVAEYVRNLENKSEYHHPTHPSLVSAKHYSARTKEIRQEQDGVMVFRGGEEEGFDIDLEFLVKNGYKRARFSNSY